MKRLLTIIIPVGALLVGCASGHCRGKAEWPEKKVFVYKSDESKQCRKGSAISLAQMAKTLGDIRIYSQEKKNDGKIYPSVCGASTGSINVYQIRAADLEQAKKRGFEEWTE